MVTRPHYNINNISKHPWVPYSGQLQTINNRSSVGHNIISHTPNTYSSAIIVGLHDTKMNNLKKGIGEFGDIQRPTANNKNYEHNAAFESNGSVFKRRDGAFTHLYDAAHRFGEDKPFKA
mmetsp:Transcript_3644/g.3589  ORF Transcript_3644/g.3589 Transcript_3644/m.3589 type:complete len:120 (+) Transcript_3644:414-773(+)